jgi:hypothetical protein
MSMSMSMGMEPIDLRARRRALKRADALAFAGRLAVPVGVVVLGLLVLVLEGHEVSWLAGLIAGGAAGGWVSLRRPAGGRGRSMPAASRRTEAAVQPLELSGWRFLHDVHGLDVTYDNIAVGHGGVILLESMSPDGVVRMRAGEPILEYRSEPDAEPRLERLRPRALADASSLRQDVARLTGRRLWVQAVVVFWSDFPAGCVTDGRCVYIHGSRLADWIARRPHQLGAAETDDVFEAVQLLAEVGGDIALQLAG